jgi:quercetin dioxygenase-like cupin family protein
LTDAKRIAHDEIPLRSGKVIDEGGELRILTGADHGLQISIMQSEVVPGSGPRRHRHPHVEVFVINAGCGHFEIDGEILEAAAGDMLVIPANAWHGFTNTGASSMRQVAIHENERGVTEFEDGTRRD